MNKSFVTIPLGKLVELLLLENKLIGFLFSSFIWTIRNKMLWTITIVALSSSKGFALEVTSFVTQCSHGAHILFDQKGHTSLKSFAEHKGASSSSQYSFTSSTSSTSTNLEWEA